MRINGEMLIGAQAVLGTAGTTRAINPATRQEIDPPFGLGSRADVDLAAVLAQAAFDPFRATSPEYRARFLEAVAQNILDLGDALIERAQAESGLPAARLTGERGRTVGQLRLFARVVRDGLYQTPVIDPAQPERTPLPRADLRLRKIALGPVAVFGASHFPLAFSVAGGDTASALARLPGHRQGTQRAFGNVGTRWPCNPESRERYRIARRRVLLADRRGSRDR